MPGRGRARRTDGTHAAIRDGLRELGAEVTDLSGVGGGIPDMIVRWRGRSVWMDAKTSGGGETSLQSDLWPRLPGGPVIVARSVEDAVSQILAVNDDMAGLEG